MERAKSHQLRNNIDNAVNIVGYEMCETWTETNKALDRRIAEMLEAKEKLQMHLHMVTNFHLHKVTKCWNVKSQQKHTNFYISIINSLL